MVLEKDQGMEVERGLAMVLEKGQGNCRGIVQGTGREILRFLDRDRDQDRTTGEVIEKSRYSPSPKRSRRYSRSPSYSRDRGSRRGFAGNREAPRPNRCLGVFGLSLYTTERQTGRSRGFAFVYYDSVDDATEAKNSCSGMEIDGRRIRVDYSITERPHTPTPGIYMGRPTYGRRGGGGGGGGGNRYSGGYSGRRRSPSPYHSRRRYRSRSRSYSPRRYRY
ncbi:Transformer-2 protein-like beta [Armadillidium vulgare]|nr:Transformer-2 protein-like beta [Armadillidium vulgare]